MPFTEKNDTLATIFLEKHYWLATAGMLGVLMLSYAMKQGRTALLEQPLYQNVTITGMQVFEVHGIEADVPQKLIDDLNNKGDQNEKF